LGGSESYAGWINSSGQVLGYSYLADGNAKPFIYENGVMKNLEDLIDPTLGFNLTPSWYSYTYPEVYQQINDVGQITGGYYNENNSMRIYLMTPANRTWIGGTDNNWGNSQNWDDNTDPVNGSSLTFSGTNGQIINNTALIHVGQIIFNAGGFSVSGNPLILNAGITSTGDNTWEINSTLSFPQTFTSLAGTLTISGSVNNNGNLLTIAGPGNHLISGAISGTGGLTKLDTGTLTLSGDNSYTGQTTINDGILELTTTGQIDKDSEIITESDGIFQINGGSHEVGLISGNGKTEVLSGQLTVNSLVQKSLKIGPGAKLILVPSSGEMLYARNDNSSVPEPSAIILLYIAAMFLMIVKGRRLQY
jgi:autotransporter-associated beta strand protein/probable HAF family extracellular repeat protein